MSVRNLLNTNNFKRTIGGGFGKQENLVGEETLQFYLDTITRTIDNGCIDIRKTETKKLLELFEVRHKSFFKTYFVQIPKYSVAEVYFATISRVFDQLSIEYPEQKNKLIKQYTKEFESYTSGSNFREAFEILEERCTESLITAGLDLVKYMIKFTTFEKIRL
jgi:hypothetical protein